MTTARPKRLGLGRKEVAKAMGVACRTVESWRENGCPQHPDGSYDIEVVKAWREAREAKRRPPKPEGDELGNDWASRDERAIALIREKKLADIYDQYFHRDHVQRLLLDRADALKRGLLELGRVLQEDFPDTGGLEERTNVIVEDLLAAYAKQNVVALLEQWRRQAKNGVKIGRGRGRPKGT